MTSIFWGLRLEPGKRYSTTVDKSFHVSMAALDCTSVKHGHENDLLSVMLEEAGSETPFILCNLQKGKVNQSTLDLNFMTGDRVTFFAKGGATIHLTGYIVPDEDDLDPFGEGEEGEVEDEDEEEEQSIEDVIMNGPRKRKGAELSTINKKAKQLENSDDDADENGADLDVDSDESGEEEDSDDDDDDDDNENEIEDSDESEEENAPIVAKPGKKSLNVTVSPKVKKIQLTSNGAAALPSKKEKRKSEKAETPGSQKQNKSISEGSPQKRTLEGGVIVKDLKVGNGPVCKEGTKVAVYYTGRLKSNNKVFDSITKGAGFQFKFGVEDVIKGWDIGLKGMKVGGKRLLIVPAPMAYGAMGSPPTIPGNSTLIFEVEMKSVKKL